MFLRNVDYFRRNKQRYIPEDGKLTENPSSSWLNFLFKSIIKRRYSNFISFILSRIWGCCMTYNRGFGFDDRVYCTLYNLLQHFTHHYRRLETLDFWPHDTNPLLYLFSTLICLGKSKSSQSHITTDGQSVSKSWCRAPSGAHDQIFITAWQLRSCFMWGALSDERMDLSSVYATGPCQRSIS
jgi:hypothetical protein